MGQIVEILGTCPQKFLCIGSLEEMLAGEDGVCGCEAAAFDIMRIGGWGSGFESHRTHNFGALGLIFLFFYFSRAYVQI